MIHWDAFDHLMHATGTRNQTGAFLQCPCPNNDVLGCTDGHTLIVKGETGENKTNLCAVSQFVIVILGRKHRDKTAGGLHAELEGHRKDENFNFFIYIFSISAVCIFLSRRQSFPQTGNNSSHSSTSRGLYTNEVLKI